MSILLRHGALVNARYEEGETPLHVALVSRHHCKHDTSDAAELLIRYGADTNAQDKNGRTTLHNAISSDIGVDLLLANSAHVDIPDNNGRTALCHAISRNDARDAQPLINLGADVNIIDVSGQHLLHEMANKFLIIDGFKIIFEGKKTPDIEVLNHNGESALFVVLKNGDHTTFWPLLNDMRRSLNQNSDKHAIGVKSK